jgi:hypothetical protein
MRLDEHLAVRRDCTRRVLFRRAGLSPSARTVTSLHDFFRNQTFIPTTKSCLHTLAHMAANSPFFFLNGREP